MMGPAEDSVSGVGELIPEGQDPEAGYPRDQNKTKHNWFRYLQRELTSIIFLYLLKIDSFLI